MGVKLQLSTSVPPETDRRSERTNKTVVQVLRQYISRQQKDWTPYLPTVELSINTAVNESTVFRRSSSSSGSTLHSRLPPRPSTVPDVK
jgi:hypothetical protein